MSRRFLVCIILSTLFAGIRSHLRAQDVYESQLRISHFRRVAAGRLLFCWVA